MLRDLVVGLALAVGTVLLVVAFATPPSQVVSSPAAAAAAIPTASATVPAPERPQQFPVLAIETIYGTWRGEHSMQVRQVSLPTAAAVLEIEDEVTCFFTKDLRTGKRPSELANDPRDPTKGVWWIASCKGPRLRPGAGHTLRAAAYYSTGATPERKTLYVVLGDLQYGPFDET